MDLSGAGEETVMDKLVVAQVHIVVMDGCPIAIKILPK
jgi:hypothetical protein